METFFLQLLNAPVPESLTKVPPQVEEKIKNFKVFLKEISKKEENADDSDIKQIDAILISNEINVETSKLLYILSTQILPRIGKEKVETMLRGYYKYEEAHTDRVLKYLTFLELAYNGSIDWSN